MRLIPADKVKELLHSGWSLDTDADVEYVCSLVDEIPGYDAWISVKDWMPDQAAIATDINVPGKEGE